MLICDYCKKDEDPSQHNVFMAGPGEREIITSLDLCKGCAPIFRKKIEDMVREIKRRKK